MLRVMLGGPAALPPPSRCMRVMEPTRAEVMAKRFLSLYRATLDLERPNVAATG